ncbi:hypothetical protein [Azospirillum sp. sgz302134]
MAEPAPTDRVSIDVPEFIGNTKGWNGGVQLGNLELFEFTPLMKQVDPTGALRQKMCDALNAAPGLRVEMMHAAFSRAPAKATS